MAVADRAGDEHLGDPKRKIEIEESGDDGVSSQGTLPCPIHPIATGSSRSRYSFRLGRALALPRLPPPRTIVRDQGAGTGPGATGAAAGWTITVTGLGLTTTVS